MIITTVCLDVEHHMSSNTRELRVRRVRVEQNAVCELADAVVCQYHVQ
jgi:hypothetical protein